MQLRMYTLVRFVYCLDMEHKGNDRTVQLQFFFSFMLSECIERLILPLPLKRGIITRVQHNRSIYLDFEVPIGPGAPCRGFLKDIFF